ncbi:MAG: hypothetical protein IPM50_07145 [Acidobacteriota bacterium]|nr:MAG: hypothetical protein IPM50_07145 [Acidobacteriota bacterium]
MKKWILGIVLVGIIQFAFVVYTQLQAPLELDVAAVEFGADPLTPSPVSIDGPAPSSEPAKNWDISGLRAVSRNSDVYASAIKRPARKNSTFAAKTDGSKADRINFTPPKPARSEDHNTVAVSYSDARKTADCDGFDDEARQKRSFIAKAAPVVKKPWEWMKALGSKFN